MSLCKGSANGLGDTTLTAEKEYSINFFEQQRKFCLSFYYDGANSYLFVNSAKIYKFNAKYSGINAPPLCRGWICFMFSFHFDSADVDDILDIHKNLMVTNKVIFCLIKQVLIGLLSFSGILATK